MSTSRAAARVPRGHAAAAPPSAASNSRRPMVTVIRPSRARCVEGRISRHKLAVLAFKEGRMLVASTSVAGRSGKAQNDQMFFPACPPSSDLGVIAAVLPDRARLLGLAGSRARGGVRLHSPVLYFSPEP